MSYIFYPSTSIAKRPTQPGRPPRPGRATERALEHFAKALKLTQIRQASLGTPAAARAQWELDEAERKRDYWMRQGDFEMAVYVKGCARVRRALANL